MTICPASFWLLILNGQLATPWFPESVATSSDDPPGVSTARLRFPGRGQLKVPGPRLVQRLIGAILGWGDMRDDVVVRDFVRGHPFAAFRPATTKPVRGRSHLRRRVRTGGLEPGPAEVGKMASTEGQFIAGRDGFLEAAANLSRYHREHEKYYPEVPLTEAVALGRTVRTLIALAERWTTAEPVTAPGCQPVRRHTGPQRGPRHRNERRAVHGGRRRARRSPARTSVAGASSVSR